MKPWKCVCAILAALLLAAVPASAVIIVDYIPNPTATPDGFSTVIYGTVPVQGTLASMISIERYRANGAFATSWDYFDVVPNPVPNGARWNTDRFNGYYNVAFIDLMPYYQDYTGPNLVGWWVDESVTYQNMPNYITYVEIRPTYDPFAFLDATGGWYDPDNPIWDWN